MPVRCVSTRLSWRAGGRPGRRCVSSAGRASRRGAGGTCTVARGVGRGPGARKRVCRVHHSGNREPRSPAMATNLRAKQAEAVNRVENGVKSGPALTRTRAALPAIQAAAQRFKQRTFAVTGGVRIDPMTRVERRVGGNPNLSPEGQAAELTAARDEFQAAGNGALQGANDGLHTV